MFPRLILCRRLRLWRDRPRLRGACAGCRRNADVGRRSCAAEQVGGVGEREGAAVGCTRPQRRASPSPSSGRKERVKTKRRFSDESVCDGPALTTHSPTLTEKALKLTSATPRGVSEGH
ncbi:hypothetical protein AAFF_G00158780 [Aldrovandia affinis]|uniref:Uncharacterized protein n=1 Tax=Aldrovandia affinis TaxID=143900 RepID=A0AAD7W8E3_9TELE|nr:hypothetical protein AAFF_G00158780 [Aldrovandia affinis]